MRFLHVVGDIESSVSLLRAFSSIKTAQIGMYVKYVKSIANEIRLHTEKS